MTTPTDHTLGDYFSRTGDLVHQPKLFVMGDSHSLFFAGVESLDADASASIAHAGYRVYYLGAGLAYSLIKPHSRNRTREKINIAMQEVLGMKDKSVLFAFGEIDCRYHIRQRAGAMPGGDTAENIHTFLRLTVLRYIAFLLDMRKLGVEPIVWTPIASTTHPADMHQWITLGTTQERNAITRDFIALLKKETAPYNIPVLSVFDQLIDAELNTRPDFSSDAVHLSQRFWPLWLEQAKLVGIE